jgi:hypothetical protein
VVLRHDERRRQQCCIIMMPDGGNFTLSVWDGWWWVKTGFFLLVP